MRSIASGVVLLALDSHATQVPPRLTESATVWQIESATLPAYACDVTKTRFCPVETLPVAMSSPPMVVPPPPPPPPPFPLPPLPTAVPHWQTPKVPSPRHTCAPPLPSLQTQAADWPGTHVLLAPQPVVIKVKSTKPRMVPPKRSDH